jgi:hypothetical protein
MSRVPESLRITRRSIKNLNEEDHRYWVRGEIRRIKNLSQDTMAFILPSVTLEIAARSVQEMEELVIRARKELGNWHRHENKRFCGAGKKQQANQGRDAEEFRICVAGVLILNGKQRDFAPFERILRRSTARHRKV